VIDPKHQARLGLPFVAQLEHGGLGRIDGLARGIICGVSNRGAAMAERGMLVKQVTVVDASPGVVVEVTNDVEDEVYGIMLEDTDHNETGLCIIFGLSVFVQTTGTIAVGDKLGPSATPGLAAPVSGAGSSFGRSRGEATGTDDVRADIRGGALSSLEPGTLCQAHQFFQQGTFVRSEAEGSDNQGTTTEIQVDADNLLMLAFHSANEVNISASTWHDGPGAPGATTQALTQFEEEHTSDDHWLELWYKYDPNQSLNANSGVTAASADGRFAHCIMLYSGVDATSILRAESSSGTADTQTQTITGLVEGQIVVAVLAYHNDLDGAPATPSGWTHRDQAQGSGVHEAAIHAVDRIVAFGEEELTVTWPVDTHVGSGAGEGWTIMMVVLDGGSIQGDGRIDLVGTSGSVKRCDDTEHYHTDRDPTVDDDDYLGYRNNTLWFNETSGEVFWLIDNTIGAADWISIAGGPHATSHQSGGTDPIKLDDLDTPDDNTDLNATIGRHGLLRKLSNDPAEFLNGQGDWAEPSGGGGSGHTHPNKFGDTTYDATIVAHANCIAYWPLDETSGTTAEDDEGSADGTVATADHVIMGSAGEITFDGRPSAFFTGLAGSRISMGTGRTIPASYSLEAWVRPLFSTQLENCSLVGRWLTNGCMIFGNGGGFRLHQTAQSSCRWSPGWGYFCDGEWHHIVGTYDGTNAKLYVDGVLRSTQAYSAHAAPAGSTVFELGSYSNGGGSEYTGYMAAVALYDAAISLADVEDHYDRGGA